MNAPAEPNSWVYVCRVDAIVANTGVCARVGDAQVAVFRLVDPRTGEQSLFGLNNIDPRSGAAVLSRGLLGDVGGEPAVASPLYKQHYALRDGRCLEDAKLSVAAYPIRLADGLVLVRRQPLAAGESQEQQV